MRARALAAWPVALAPVCVALGGIADATPPAARGLQEDAAAAALDATDDGRDLRRVLHLDDGRVLRARSRRVDGAWQVRSDREWRSVAREVVRACSERELLAEARRREGALAAGAPEARVALARWMIEEGLVEESFAHLDRVLRDDPGSGAVHALFADLDLAALDGLVDDDAGAPLVRGSADELARWIRLGAGASAARQEAAVARIAAFADRTDLLALARAELTTHQPQRRAFAARLAARLFPKELVPDLARRALLDGMGDVRRAATSAMRASDDVAVLAPVAQGLASKNAMVRNHAVEALGALAHPAAVEPLVAHLAAVQSGGAPSGSRANLDVGFQTAYVMDYDVEIAQAASIADPIVAVQSSGVIFDVRSVVQITREVEVVTTIRSLQELTGRADLDEPREWQSWWQENAADWDSAKLAEARPHLLPRSAPTTGAPR